MASQNIGVGSAANDGTGDPLRDAFVKIRKNFAEVYGQTYSSDTQDLSGTSLAFKANQMSLTNTADSSTDGFVLTFDNTSGGFTLEQKFDGDITSIVAGDGLSGSSLSAGDATVNLDLNDLTAATVNVANDSIAFVDADDSNATRKETIADFVSGIAGSGLSASNGQLSASGSSYAVANSANNRILTSVDSTNGNAEADLTFDGNNLVVDGDGSTGGVTVSDGSIQMRTGTGNVAEIRMYCESSNAHFQTLKAQPHSAASSAVLTLPTTTGTLVGTGDTDSVSNTMIADDAVDHDQLANRYTASGSISTLQGTVSVNWANATNYIMSGDITGAITFNFTEFKKGQVLTIHRLQGSYTITLDADSTSEEFNKLGGNDYDGSTLNALMVECIDDDSSAIFNYSILTYTADTTP
tara:strand:- start:440 stop:1672 length:1233 start_codon:yes stop_codon:yes gene_type:complete